MDNALTTKQAARTTELNARIVIVDDGSLKLASEALEMLGYAVEPASDERQVQTIVGRAAPNLILVDFALPGAAGIIRKLKSNRELMHVPIVAVTGSAVNGGNAADVAGCDGCIIGPVDTRKLPLQVAAFLVRGAGRLAVASAT